VLDPTVVVDDKGHLANVVVYVTGGLPQQSYDPPDEPAVALYDKLGTREEVLHFDISVSGDR